jgi:hypothetical protein
LFHLLGTPSERKRRGLKRATEPVDVQALPPPLTVGHPASRIIA